MIRIESITLREIHLALKEPFQISSGIQTRRRIILVQMTDADGTEGWGECTAGEFPNYSPDDGRHGVDRHPRVGGARGCSARPSRGPEEIHPVLEENFRGHNMAKAAVEMGAWELAARQEGDLPLARCSAARASASRRGSRSASRRPRGAGGEGAGRARAGLPEGQDQDQAGRGRRVRGRGARGARARRAADGRREQRLHARRRATAWPRSTSSAS